MGRHTGKRLSGGQGNGAHVLICPTDYFDVVYEINPWMGKTVQVDKGLARSQWEALYRLLSEEIGATIELVNPLEGLPDLVFTANAGLSVGKTFIVSRFRHPQRAHEEPYWHAWFEQRGYEVVCLPAEVRFEGEGDMLRCGELLVAGYRFRSDQEAAYWIGELLEREVLSNYLKMARRHCRRNHRSAHASCNTPR